VWAIRRGPFYSPIGRRRRQNGGRCNGQLWKREGEGGERRREEGGGSREERGGGSLWRTGIY